MKKKRNKKKKKTKKRKVMLGKERNTSPLDDDWCAIYWVRGLHTCIRTHICRYGRSFVRKLRTKRVREKTRRRWRKGVIVTQHWWRCRWEWERCCDGNFTCYLLLNLTSINLYFGLQFLLHSKQTASLNTPIGYCIDCVVTLDTCRPAQCEEDIRAISANASGAYNYLYFTMLHQRSWAPE